MPTMSYGSETTSNPSDSYNFTKCACAWTSMTVSTNHSLHTSLARSNNARPFPDLGIDCQLTLDQEEPSLFQE